jgi:hypothetical protein
MDDTFKAIANNTDAVNVAYYGTYLALMVTEKRDTSVVCASFVVTPAGY